MWPIGHLAVGYLAYVGVAAGTGRSLPADWRVLAAVAVGTQLPDVVDKPLGYWAVLPSGRSFAHSLVVLLAVVAGAWALSGSLHERWDGHRLGDAVSGYGLPLLVGHLSHLAADSSGAVLAWELAELRYLAWPLLPVSRSPADAVAPWIRLLELSLTPQVRLEFLLAGLALGVFVALRLRER